MSSFEPSPGPCRDAGVTGSPASATVVVTGVVDAVHLEAEVGADVGAQLAPGAASGAAAGSGSRVGSPRSVIDQHVAAGTRGCTARSPCTSRDVDGDGATALDAPPLDGAHAWASANAGAVSGSTASNPARSASSFFAMCWVRYGGMDSRIPSIAASRPTSPVVARYAPVMTSDDPSSLPSAEREVARRHPHHLESVGVERRLERRVVHEHEAAVAHLRTDLGPVLVVHADRRPGVRQHRWRLDGRVAHHHGRVGVHAAHRARVDAEQEHVATFDGRAARDHLCGELHALAADPAEHELTLHQSAIPRSANVTRCSTSAVDGCSRRTTASCIRPIARW